MRLYPKKLNGVAGLEREKQLLLKQSSQLDVQDLLSLRGKNQKGKDKGNALTGLMSNPVVEQLIKIATSYLNKKNDRGPTENEAPAEKPRKSILKRAAIEFIGGYLKWKAIELSCKGIRHIIKKRKEQDNPE